MNTSPDHGTRMASETQKSVLITGASQGIGRATVLYLASCGYKIVAAGRSLERLRILQAHSDTPDNVIPWELDVGNPVCADQVPLIIERVGRLDVLVNNAGYGLRGYLEELDMGDVQAQFETNLFSTLRLSQAVIPHMRENGGGAIINIGSVSAHIASPSGGAYASTKSAMRSLTMALRLELHSFGIKVAVIEPGVIRANFLQNQVRARGNANPDSPYAARTSVVEERTARFHHTGGNPLKVARTVERIIRSKHPHPSYTIGPDGRLGVFAARFLPERLVQYCVRKVLMG